jgi:predicted metalloendopeptidase
LANVSLIDTDIVTVSEVEYLRNISLIINQQSPRTLQNYMVWRFIMIQITNMPKRFRTIEQEFQHIFRGTNAQQSRSIRCGEYVNNNMGAAVAKLYINEYFDKNSLIEVH